MKGDYHRYLAEVHTHTHVNVYVHTYSHTYSYAYMCAHVHTHTYTCMCAHVHTCTHADIHSWNMNTHTRLCMSRQTHAHMLQCAQTNHREYKWINIDKRTQPRTICTYFLPSHPDKHTAAYYILPLLHINGFYLSFHGFSSRTVTYVRRAQQRL